LPKTNKTTPNHYWFVLINHESLDFFARDVQKNKRSCQSWLQNHLLYLFLSRKKSRILASSITDSYQYRFINVILSSKQQFRHCFLKSRIMFPNHMKYYVFIKLRHFQRWCTYQSDDLCISTLPSFWLPMIIWALKNQAPPTQDIDTDITYCNILIIASLNLKYQTS
jgi:hypothetical protein